VVAGYGAQSTEMKLKALKSVITSLKSEDVDDMTAPEFLELLQELYDFLYKEMGFEVEELITRKM